MAAALCFSFIPAFISFIFSLHVLPPHPSLPAPISQRGTRAGSRSGVLVEVVRGGCESLSPRRALQWGEPFTASLLALIFVHKEPKQAQVAVPSLTPCPRCWMLQGAKQKN